MDGKESKIKSWREEMFDKKSMKIKDLRDNISVIRKDIRELMVENLNYSPSTEEQKLEELEYFRGAIEFMRKKWVLEIIWELETYKGLHFNALKREIKDISSKALSDCLKELQKENLISRTVEDTRPPKTFYQLNEKGIAFVELIMIIILFLKDIL